MKHRKLNRLAGYDYSNPGAYFITICVKNRQPAFGEIINKKMVLNERGKIAEFCWNDLPNHYLNIYLDEFVVMPNHVHGIVAILRREQACLFPTIPFPTIDNDRRQYQKLPIIIGSFKSAVTKYIHRAGNTEFQWQKSYYDRIIRDPYEYH